MKKIEKIGRGQKSKMKEMRVGGVWRVQQVVPHLSKTRIWLNIKSYFIWVNGPKID